MRDDNIRVSCGFRQIVVDPAERRHHHVTHQILGTPHRVHDAGDELPVGWISFRPRGMEFEPRIFDVRAVARRHREHGTMTARLQRLAEAQVRIEVPVRTE
jgi:hypothetical protein